MFPRRSSPRGYGPLIHGRHAKHPALEVFNLAVLLEGDQKVGELVGVAGHDTELTALASSWAPDGLALWVLVARGYGAGRCSPKWMRTPKASRG